jgi:hypothetical protein
MKVVALPQGGRGAKRKEVNAPGYEVDVLAFGGSGG